MRRTIAPVQYIKLCAEFTEGAPAGPVAARRPFNSAQDVDEELRARPPPCGRMTAGPIGLVVLRVAQSCAGAWPRTLAAFVPGCVVVSDAWNHASMFETIRHSLAEKRIFAYNEFLFGCRTDVPQDGSRELGKEALEEVEPRAVLGSEGEFAALTNK
jgi:hypothetical protein